MKSLFVMCLVVLLVQLTQYGAHGHLIVDQSVSRKQWMDYTCKIATFGSLSIPYQSHAAVDLISIATTTKPKFDVYQVLPDASASLNPSIKILEKQELFDRLCKVPSGALWLGEHHNSIKDHTLQVEILQHVAKDRSKIGKSTAVGLEQVQLRFQSVLDDYIAGRINLFQLQQGVEWNKRWIWPFEIYQPIFETAKSLNIPLVALNVDSEDLSLVEKAGLPGLPKDRLFKYISDPLGFAKFAQTGEFSTYVGYVIRPSYDMHDSIGLLRYTMSGERLPEKMSFRNFFSSRILWDESMANAAYKYVQNHENMLLIGLVGADHVKFGNGVSGRFTRMSGSNNECLSIMLNPTLIDTRPSGTVGIEGIASDRPDTITLQLRYDKDNKVANQYTESISESTGGVLPLADYILVG